jgi:hypothetical protein
MKTFGLLIGALGLVGCSAGVALPGVGDGGVGSDASTTQPPPIKASDYDQSCKINGDCAAVTDGQVCGCQQCGGNAAVNVSDVQRINADFAARRAMCPPMNEPCPLGLCAQVHAYCSAGKCAVCNDATCPGLAQGTACDPKNDMCKIGLLCCKQGGAQPADGGTSPSVCTYPQGSGSTATCPPVL